MITTVLLITTLAAPAQPRAGAPSTTPAPAAFRSPAAPAAASDGPLPMLQAKASEIQALMGKKADDARKKKLREMVAEVVDYTALAKASLKSRWDERTDAERMEFTELLRKLIEKSYLENVERRPDFTIAWQSERLLQDGAKAKVKSLASAGKVTIEIEYRLAARPDLRSGWQVADIVIDEVSMVRNYRRSFKKIIKNEGWPALLGKMQDKLDD